VSVTAIDPDTSVVPLSRVTNFDDLFERRLTAYLSQKFEVRPVTCAPSGIGDRGAADAAMSLQKNVIVFVCKSFCNIENQKNDAMAQAIDSGSGNETARPSAGSLVHWPSLGEHLSDRWHCLDAALAMYSTFYNFARIPRDRRLTPAMAAGIATRKWDVSDIVKLLDKQRT
jgi:hypothetical protein